MCGQTDQLLRAWRAVGGGKWAGTSTRCWACNITALVIILQDFRENHSTMTFYKNSLTSNDYCSCTPPICGPLLSPPDPWIFRPSVQAIAMLWDPPWPETLPRQIVVKPPRPLGCIPGHQVHWAPSSRPIILQVLWANYNHALGSCIIPNHPQANCPLGHQVPRPPALSSGPLYGPKPSSSRLSSRPSGP